MECISDVVFADYKGKDGIIHISPFTCMPEIMSQNMIKEKKKGLLEVIIKVIEKIK